MPTKDSVFYLCGPTASGKTALGMQLAEKVDDLVFVNADTMQLYRGLEPLAAHPSAQDLSRVEHRMFSVLEPRERFSRRQWLHMAVNEVAAILEQGRVPVLVGGSRSLAAELAEAAWGLHLPVDQTVALTFDRAVATPIELGFELRVLAVMKPVADLEVRIRTRLASNRTQAIQCVGDMLERLGDDDGVLEHAGLWTFGFREMRDYLAGCTTLEQAEDAITARTMAYAAEQRTLFARMCSAVSMLDPSSVLELRDVQPADLERATDFVRSWTGRETSLRVPSSPH
jgi:tRNA A37 N6-isopentenylltransferase MiaA